MNSLVSLKSNDMPRNWESTTDHTDVFIHQTNCLYLLSFLVTADHRIADKCFSRALDEYVEVQSGFLEWAREDGRRAVLRHAIQIVKPAPNRAFGWSITRAARSLPSAGRQPFAFITSLSAFERFVFVMLESEGLSDEECSALLGCSLRDVAIGHELAQRIIVTEEIDKDWAQKRTDASSPALLGYQRCRAC